MNTTCVSRQLTTLAIVESGIAIGLWWNLSPCPVDLTREVSERKLRKEALAVRGSSAAH